MSNKFAFGKRALGICDRCGFQYKLKQLRELYVKLTKTNILVCRACYEKDHPQLQLGMYPVYDPQAIRNPRPDSSYWQGGLTGMQVEPDKSDIGMSSGGSRDIYWGWNPVGFQNVYGLTGLRDTLVGICEVGSVEILTS